MESRWAHNPELLFESVPAPIYTPTDRNMMDNKTLVAILSGVALLCLTMIGVVFIASDNDPAPTPTPTVTSSPSEDSTEDAVLEILEQTWNEQSSEDQASLCLLFNTSPDVAFNSFNNGSDGLVSEEVFDQFFTSVCLL